MDPCTVTQATRTQLASLGVDISGTQAKLDKLAKQANENLYMLGSSFLDMLKTNFTNSLNALLTGVASQMTTKLAQSLNTGIEFISSMVSLLVMIASSGTQVQLLFISQLRRELNIRISLFRLLIYHYRSLLRILKLLRSPQSASYKKLLAALPYVRRAEALFAKVILAEGTIEGLPPRISRTALRNGFNNIEMAYRILSFDATKGSTDLGNILSLQVSGRRVGKKRWEEAQKKVVNDLFLKSLITSLAYLEQISWHYMRICSLLPLPFAASEAIFLPHNYMDTLLKQNNMTSTGLDLLRPTQQDEALIDIERGILNEQNKTIAAVAGDIVNSVDLIKGIIPTNIVINSLINTIANYPNFNEHLASATSALIASLIPVADKTTVIKQGMEEALAAQDSDIILAGKEAIWVSELNIILNSKALYVPGMEGQSILNTDAYNISRLVKLLEEMQGSFVIAEKVPKFIAQSLVIMRAPVNRRSLEESIILVTFILKQLEKAIALDKKVLTAIGDISEPLSQFKDLLKTASNLEAPVSTIANSLLTGQAQQVLGFITAIAFGSIDSIKSLFNPACPEVKSTGDLELSSFDKLADDIYDYEAKK